MTQKVNKTPQIARPFKANTVDAIWSYLTTLTSTVYLEFIDHAQRLNLAITSDGEEPMTKPFVLMAYAKADLPFASSWTYGIVYVTDDVGGAIPAFSDGTNWRRVTDRAIIS